MKTVLVLVLLHYGSVDEVRTERYEVGASCETVRASVVSELDRRLDLKVVKTQCEVK